MADAIHNLKCTFADEVVSYIYDELDEREKFLFEDHLPNCSFCIDELAEISYSRYSVYEWQRSEFVPLPTPHIVLPGARISLIDKISEWFFLPAATFKQVRNWGLATAFAAIIVFAGIALMTFDESGNLAENDPPIDSEIIEQPVAEISASETGIELSPVSVNEEAAAKQSRVVAKADQKKTTGDSSNHRPIRRQNSERQIPVSVKSPKPLEEKQTAHENLVQQSPRLVEFDDFVDESPRLSDLLDEIDVSE